MTGDSDSGAGQLGDFIRMQRQLADLSLRRMSDLTKVSNAYLSQVERGLHQPSIRVLRSIATALNVSAETLFAQAGILDPTADGSQGSDADIGTDTETAIRNDPLLAPADQDALIRVYRSLRQDPAASE